MSEPPQVPQPFQPPFPDSASPRPEEARIGCGKPVLVGCALLLLLLLGGSVLLVGNAGKVFRWGLSQSRSAIMQALPEEMEEEEVARLEQAFEAVAEGVGSGRIERDELPVLQSGLQEALAKAQSQQLSRDDVLRLTERLEKVAGDPP